MVNVNPQAPPPEAFVSFSAEVDVKTVEQLLSVMANFANSGVPKVHLLLSSPGGSVMHGINAYNVLKGMPFTLVTHNVGNVDSIGNAIFLAGDERYACEHSTFMFHGVAYNGGNLIYDPKLATERLDGLKADQARIGSIIVDRTNLAKSKVDGFFKNAKTLTAQDALAGGIISEIRPVIIPPGSPVASLVINR
jgi:ATP-dependent Clp protease protease subunit